MSAPATDGAALRHLFGHVPSGLVTVAVLGPDGPTGLLVATFTPVSLDPPLVSVTIGRGSSTFPVLRARSHWGLSVLADHQHHVADRFRLPSAQRFTGLDWAATELGAVHVSCAVATLTVRPVQLVPAGDHVIAILAVDDHRTDTGTPLVFHHSRFHRLEKEILR